MTTHLGGPEAEARLVDRHRRYHAPGDGRMFRVEVDGAPAGSVGYWGEVGFEYPPGRPVRCNDWGVEL
ncbi:hypothetical protein [Saccharothrix lopnurensis]|uniref:GNAT family N-acetyltransferase n=1 Tax=Saccharothrix lopnurensis TaxID=1670621 RepID=A0ABW1PHA0_9PSEU